MSEAKIVSARNQKNGSWDPVDVFVKYEGSDQEVKLTDFFDDEIYVNPTRLIGKTKEEALAYKHALDVAYLRS